MAAAPEHECLLCYRSFAVGAGSASVRPVKAWADAMICNECRIANRDGIVPVGHPRLAAYLKAHDIAPMLNENGWIDIPR